MPLTFFFIKLPGLQANLSHSLSLFHNIMNFQMFSLNHQFEPNRSQNINIEVQSKPQEYLLGFLEIHEN